MSSRHLSASHFLAPQIIRSASFQGCSISKPFARAGNPKRYRNLFGITGTGLGGGIVRNGEPLLGDNSAGGDAWLLHNKLGPEVNAEEGASIRGVLRAYAAAYGIAADTPGPRTIGEIALGKADGNQAAACEAFRRMGDVTGDVLAQALTLVDGLAVIGGGIAGAHPLFLDAPVSAMNAPYENCPRRLAPVPFNIEDPAQRERLLRGEVRTVEVTDSGPRICYDPMREPPSESAASARARRWWWVRTRRRCGSWMWGKTPGLPGATCASSAREQARRPTLRSRS